MAGKGRKFDRNKKSASMARYNAEGRDKVNKAKNIAKAKREAKTKKELKVPRGTARALRRGNEKPTMPPEV